MVTTVKKHLRFLNGKVPYVLNHSVYYTKADQFLYYSLKNKDQEVQIHSAAGLCYLTTEITSKKFKHGLKV